MDFLVLPTLPPSQNTPHTHKIFKERFYLNSLRTSEMFLTRKTTAVLHTQVHMHTKHPPEHCLPSLLRQMVYGLGQAACTEQRSGESHPQESSRPETVPSTDGAHRRTVGWPLFLSSH